MICNVCDDAKRDDDFYKNDRTCKECRKEKVRRNRAGKLDYYREYDKKRFKHDPRVKARHKSYAATEAGKEKHREASLRYIEKHPIKRAVHILTGNAIRDGRLIKKPCESCGINENIHAHHDDYCHPMLVTWLCAKCHAEWHSINGDGASLL